MSSESCDKKLSIEKVTLEKKLTIERAFTTAPQIKRHRRPFCSIVKKKIWYMFEQLYKEYPETITHRVLTIRAKEYLGCDKETIRAYLGYIPNIRRRKRTGEGYECGVRREGYLQEFGYAARKGNVWILHHENIPGFPYHYEESFERANQECQRVNGCGVQKYDAKFLSMRVSSQPEVPESIETTESMETVENNKQQHTEREKFRGGRKSVKVFDGLSNDEKRVLEAAFNPNLACLKPRRVGEPG